MHTHYGLHDLLCREAAAPHMVNPCHHGTTITTQRIKTKKNKVVKESNMKGKTRWEIIPRPLDLEVACNKLQLGQSVIKHHNFFWNHIIFLHKFYQLRCHSLGKKIIWNMHRRSKKINNHNLGLYHSQRQTVEVPNSKLKCSAFNKMEKNWTTWFAKHQVANK